MRSSQVHLHKALMALEDINKESAPQQTPAQEALSSWVSKRFESLRRDRWAEERE
jgi:hypothetical protein